MECQPAKSKTSSFARMKKMREKLKLTDPEYQKNENKRISDLKMKKKQTMSKKEQKELRKYERDRKHLQKARKRGKPTISSLHSSKMSVGSVLSPYCCQQTYSKAMLKTLRVLPKSPNKKKAVVSELAERVGIHLSSKMYSDIAKYSTENYTNYSVVTDFYFRPDITYTCPGMKDSITVWEGGKKVTLQQHYLTMFLRESFAVFKEENLDFQIGFSKFCSLRPKNVLLLKNTPSDQCKCKTHENFKLKIKGLKYTYGNEFWENSLCDCSLNSQCWQNLCGNCTNGKLLSTTSHLETTVVWKE